jgi:hypothetical protein
MRNGSHCTIEKSDGRFGRENRAVRDARIGAASRAASKDGGLRHKTPARIVTRRVISLSNDPHRDAGNPARRTADLRANPKFALVAKADVDITPDE